MSLGRSLVLTGLGLVLGATVTGSSLALREAGRTLSWIEAAAAVSNRGTAKADRARDAADYRDRLRSRGLTEDEIKPLVLAMLAGGIEGEGPFTSRAYWRDERADAIRARLARLGAESGVRGALREIYGPAAERDEAFAAFFRPLGGRFDFLASQAQLRWREARLRAALERVETEEARAPRALMVRRGEPGSGASSGAGPALGIADPTAGAAKLLGARDGFEVALRDSNLAEQLRRLGLGFSEAEFRETYRLLAALLGEPAGPEAYGSARRALRKLLGSDRFDRLWASRDPVFGVVAPLLRSRGITEETVFAVYGVMNRSQDDLADAARLNAVDPERAIEVAREAAARERTRLEALIGADLAGRVLTARAQAFLERGRPASLDSSQLQGEYP